MALEVGSVLTFFEGRAEQLFTTIDQIESRINALSGKDLVLNISTRTRDTRDIEISVNKIQGQLDQLSEKQVSIDLDSSTVLESIERIEQKVNSLESKPVSIPTESALSGSDQLNDSLVKIGNTLDIIADEIISFVDIVTGALDTVAELFDDTLDKAKNGAAKGVNFLETTLSFVGVSAGSLFGILGTGVINILNGVSTASGALLDMGTVLEFLGGSVSQFAGIVTSLFSFSLSGLTLITDRIFSVGAGIASIENIAKNFFAFFVGGTAALGPPLLLIPFLLRNSALLFNRLRGKGKEAQGPLVRIVELVKTLNIGLTRSFLSFGQFATAAAGLGAIIVNPFLSLIATTPIINSFVSGFIALAGKIKDRTVEIFGGGAARSKLLINDIRDIVRLLTKLGKGPLNDIIKNFAKAGKRARDLRANIKGGGEGVQQLQSISRLRLPFAQQFQIFSAEMKVFLSEITTSINRLLITVQRVFNIPFSELATINNQAKKTLGGINKEVVNVGENFQKITGTKRAPLLTRVERIKAAFIGLGKFFLRSPLDIFPKKKTAATPKIQDVIGFSPNQANNIFGKLSRVGQKAGDEIAEAFKNSGKTIATLINKSRADFNLLRVSISQNLKEVQETIKQTGTVAETATKKAQAEIKKPRKKEQKLIPALVTVGKDLEEFETKSKKSFSSVQKDIDKTNEKVITFINAGGVGRLAGQFQGLSIAVRNAVLGVLDLEKAFREVAKAQKELQGLTRAQAKGRGGLISAIGGGARSGEIAPNKFRISINGLISAIGRLQNEKPIDIEKILLRVFAGLNEFAARFKTQAIKIGKELSTGLSQGIIIDLPKILNALKLLDKAVADLQVALSKKGIVPGQQVTKLIAQGIKAGLPEVKSVNLQLAELVAAFYPSSEPKMGPLKGLTKKGKEIANLLSKGMMEGKSLLSKSSRESAKLISEYFPSSPAKRGPLRRLSRQGEEIPRTLAGGINKGLGSVKAASEKIAFTVSGALRNIATSPLQFIKDFVKSTNDLTLASNRLGKNFSVELASSLDFAAKRFGASFQDLNFIFRNLRRVISEAVSNPETRKSFDQLGINIFEVLNSVNPLETAFLKLTSAVDLTNASSEKTTKALQLLGAVGDTPIVNFLGQGPERIREFQREAVKGGAVVTKQLGDFARQITIINEKFSALVKFIIGRFAVDLVREITTGIDKVTEFLEKNSIVINAVGIIASNIIRKIIRALKGFFLFLVKEPREAFNQIVKQQVVFLNFIGESVLLLFSILLNEAALFVKKLVSQLFSDAGTGTRKIFSSIIVESLVFLDKLTGIISLQVKEGFKVVGEEFTRFKERIIEPFLKDIAILTNPLALTGKGIDRILSSDKLIAEQQKQIQLDNEKRDRELSEKRRKRRIKAFEEFNTRNKDTRIAIEEGLQDFFKLGKKAEEQSNKIAIQLEKTAKANSRAFNIKQIDKLSKSFENLLKVSGETRGGKAILTVLKGIVAEIQPENLESIIKRLSSQQKAQFKQLEDSGKASAENAINTFNRVLKVSRENISKITKDIASNISNVDLGQFGKEIGDLLIKATGESFKQQASTIDANIQNIEKTITKINKDTDEVLKTFFIDPKSRIPGNIDEQAKAFKKFNQEAQKSIEGLNQQLRALNFQKFLEQNNQGLSTLNKLIQDGKSEAEKLTEEFQLQVGELEKLRLSVSSLGLSPEDSAAFIDNINRAIDQAGTNLVAALNANVLNALADGLEGVLMRFVQEGKLSFKSIAEFGENIFEASFQNITDFLKTSLKGALTEVFKSIGATEELGALAISGITAIAGLLLSRIKSEVTVTNKAIQDTIEKAEQVRGVIAGERTIGIQEVVDRLVNANTPIVFELQQIKQVLFDIRDGTSEAGNADPLGFSTEQLGF